MRSILYLCVFTLLTVSGISQSFEYENLNWEEDPKWVAMDTSYNSEQEVVLKYNRTVEFAYSEKYNNRLVEYFTIHKKVRVLGDDAVQYNNKVYIGMNRVIELLDAKARVITPDNKVIDFDESNIKENESNEEDEGFKYFAVDGVVVGSDVEYTYTVLRVPSYNGTKMSFQDDYLKTNVSFKLVAPDNLEFAFKSYNGLPDVVKDSANEDKNVYELFADTIPALQDEDYAPYDKNLQSVVYKLDKNYASHKYNIISFGEISQTLYEIYYGEISGANRKKLMKFINESGANKAETDEEKIRMIETAIKSKIALIENVEIKQIKDMLVDGYTSEGGMIFLTSQAMKLLEIKHDLVMTCDRYDDLFDEDFEHYQVLKNAIIYFPTIKKYMAPTEEGYRLGMIPAEWTNQKGLFIKEIAVGGLKTGLGKVKFIEPLDHEATKDVLEADIDFSDMSSPVIEFKKTISGYACVYFQPYYEMIEEEDKKNLDESLIKFSDQNGEVLEYQVSGVKQEDIGVNPMIYTGKLKTSSLMEKAGNRYLFKIGEVIGPQMEMYQEEERVMDIEHGHNKTYERVIRFEIPEGYEVSGLEDLKIKEYYPKEDPLIWFDSDYEVKGNAVEIKVIECYKQIQFSKEEIDDFRRIINAAANFNKVVLLMVKK